MMLSFVVKALLVVSLIGLTVAPAPGNVSPAPGKDDCSGAARLLLECANGTGICWYRPFLDGVYGHMGCVGWCGPPPNITNGHTTSTVFSLNATTEGNTFTYECDPGYSSPDCSVDTIVCQYNGQWSDIGFECERDCGEFALSEYFGPNAEELSSCGTNAGDTIVATCGPGYVADGLLYATCGSDGKWVPSNGSCVPACDIFTQAQLDAWNATPIDDPYDTSPYATVPLECDGHYAGCPYAECEVPSGTWTLIDGCVWDCYIPDEVPDSTLVWNVESTLEGATITYTCNGDFSETTLTCTEGDVNDGWGTYPVCSPACSPPANVEGFELDCPYLVYGSTATYTCRWDNSITYNATCASGGSWTGIPAPEDCIYDCGDFTPIANSDQTSTIVSPSTAGSYVEVTCDDGITQFNVTCTTGCGWTGALTCDANCETPSPADYTYWTFPSTPSSYASGDELTWTCDSLNTTVDVQCVDGCWEGVPAFGSCPYDCGPLTDDGTEQYRSPSNGGTLQDTIVTLQCSNGQEYTRVCTQYGWSDSFDCPDDCGLDTGITSNWQLVGLVFTHAYSGTYQNYTCPSTQSTASRCCNDGQWEGTIPECPDECESPPVLANWVQQSSTPTTGTDGEGLNFTCPSTGETCTLICVGGDWTGNLPTCHDACGNFTQAQLDAWNATPIDDPYDTSPYATVPLECDGHYAGCPYAECEVPSGMWAFVDGCVWDCGIPDVVQYSSLVWNVASTLEDATITYTCNGDFSVTTLTCTEGDPNDGWGTYPVCSPDCSPPANVEGFELDCPYLVYDSTATYTCRWNISITYEATCASGGSWTGLPAPEDCVYDCGDFTPIANSDQTSTIVSPSTAGSYVEVTCDDGITQFNVTCTTGCGWTGALTCDANCETPSPADYTYWTFPSTPSSYASGDELTWTCDSLNTTVDVQCVDGCWEGVPAFGSCPYDCGPLTDDGTEQYRSPSNGGTLQDTIVTLQCSNGQEYTRVCTQYGWSDSFDCPDDCGPDYGITSNWQLVGLVFTHAYSGTYQNYTCPSTQSTASRCCNDGQWEGTIPECPDECESPPVLANWVQQSSTPTTGTDGEGLNFTCPSTGETCTLICVGGDWTGNLPTCHDECESPPVSANWVQQSSTPTTGTDGEGLNFTCPSTGETCTLICVGGDWTGNLPTCHDACGNFTQAQLDAWNASPIDDPYDTSPYATVPLECDGHYAGCSYAECEVPSGTWTLIDGCVWDCGIPDVVQYSTLVWNVESTLEDATITYTCNGDFSETTLTCTEGDVNDGWGTYPVCSPDCSPPANVEGFELDCPYLVYGSTATYTCRWDNSITYNATCASGGSWTGIPAPEDCIYDCGDFTPIANSDQTSTSVSPSTADSYVTVTCDDGITTFNVTCNTGCGWTGALTCDANCQTPSPADYNYWTFSTTPSSYASGDQLTMVCDSLNITNDVQCDDGCWTGFPAFDSCPYDCGPLTDSGTEQYRSPPDGGDLQDTIVTLQCSNGQEYTRACTANGWSVSFDCPDDCGPDNGITSNWQLVGPTFTVAFSGTYKNYTCPSTQSTASRCCNDGQWEGTLPDCPDECTSPTVGDNWALAAGETIPTTATDGETVEYACASTAQTGNIFCVGGTWIYSLGVCPDECISPTVGDNWVLVVGETIPTTATDGKTVEYKCPSTGHTCHITCGAGTWEDNLGVCPDECTSPTVGDNWALAAGETIPTTATDGETVEYACASTAQTGNIFCVGGIWIYSLGVCPDECISPTVGDNWVLVVGETIPTTATDGKTVEYKCPSTGHTCHITCGAGTWEDNLGVCPDECTSPTVGDNWALAAGETIPTTATDGETVEYACASTAQTGNIFCVGGIWIYSLGVCPDECISPTVGDNWVLVVGETIPTTATDGKTVEYKCPSTGHTCHITCGAGTWEDNLGVCPDECTSPTVGDNWALAAGETIPTTATDGETVEYACASTAQTGNIFCVGGIWIYSLGVCPDECISPTVGDNWVLVVGETIPTTATDGKTVEYKCPSTGHTCHITCGAGTWEDNLGVCPDECTSPTVGDNWALAAGETIPTTATDGETVEYACASTAQTGNIFCVGGIWIYSLGVCPDECISPTVGDNWVLVVGETIPTTATDGKTVEYKCPSTGHTCHITCGAGTWEDNLGVCPDECVALTSTGNWELNVGETLPASGTHGEGLEYKCPSTGQTCTLVCVDGGWKGDLGQCPDNCGAITTVDLTGTNANLPTPNTGAVHGTVIVLTCEDLYEGCPVAVCVNGTWTITGTCDPATTCNNDTLPTVASSSGNDFSGDAESAVGTTVTFDCTHGGEAEIVCKGDGTWSDCVCTPGCDAPDSNDHLHWTFSTSQATYSNGDFLTWSCAATGTEHNITCVAGCWTNLPAFDSCLYDCGPLNDPNEVNRSANNDIQGTVVYLECPNGQEYTRVCTETGDWSPPIDCPDNCSAIPQSVLDSFNAATEGTNIEVVSSTVVTLTCNPNYVGCRYAQCKDGSWEYSGSCSYDCGTPPKIDWSTWSWGDPWPTGNGTVITVTCNGDGGSFNITCDEIDATGAWNVPSQCSPDCECDPLTIDYYDPPVIYGIESGDIASYVCPTTGANVNVSCTNGSWDAPGDNCPYDCGTFVTVANSTDNSSSTTGEGTVVRVTCDDGSIHDVTCESCGWTTSPYCETSCGPIPSSTLTSIGATVDGANNGEVSGNIVDLICNEYLEGCVKAQCVDGSWSIYGNCTPENTCDDNLPTVPSSDSNDHNGDAVSPVGTTVTYNCTYGGQVQIVCKAHGEWSDAACPGAEPCCEFPYIPYSTNNSHSGDEKSPSGTIVEVECANGDKLNVSCDNGQWSNQTCNIQCTEPSDIQSSVNSTYSSTTGFSPIGEVVSYWCVNEVIVNRTCLSDGTWSDTYCDAYCGEPPYPSDSTIVISPTHTDGDFYNVDDYFNYTCAAHTIVWGPGPAWQTSVCQEDGTWSIPYIECIDATGTCINAPQHEGGDVWTGRSNDKGFIFLDGWCWYATQSSDTILATMEYCTTEITTEPGSVVDPSQVTYAQALNPWMADWFMLYAREVTGSNYYWTFMKCIGGNWVDPLTNEMISYLRPEFTSTCTEGMCGVMHADNKEWQETECSSNAHSQKAICGIRMNTYAP